MPDIAASLDGSLPTVIDSRLNALQYLFGGCNLIRTHHEQLLVHIEHAVFRQDVQDSVLGKESRREVSQVCQQRILLISPIRCKLKGVTIRLLLSGPSVGFLLFGEASGV